MFLRGIQRKYRTREGMKIIRIGPSVNYKNVNDKKNERRAENGVRFVIAIDDKVRKTWGFFAFLRAEQNRPSAKG